VTRRWPSWLVAVVAGLAVVARPASAHQTSVKYVTLEVIGNRITVAFKVAPGDVTEPLGLPGDARPSARDAAASPAVAPFVAAWLAIASRDRVCASGAPATASVDRDDRFVVVIWSVTCAPPIDAVTLDFARFFAVDRSHVAIVRLSAPNSDAVDAIVRASDSVLALHLDDRGSFVAWIATGVAHIWQGADHVAFVLALLLVVMLARAREPLRWSLRPPLAALRRTAAVITAFTIAHSISLAVAALGILTLPGRLVECSIAATIVYTAAEDIARPDTRTRLALAFGFGLVHGLGFASVLAELLPPSAVALPLFGFNLGVEIGQLAIVIATLPVLYSVAWLVGPPAYRRIALPILASAILVLGLAFLVERVAGIRITGM
jgi:hypothetical protein